MSVKQMGMVWEHEFAPGEQLVMLALADHAHDDGTEIRPSVGRIAWKTGYEERQVQRILKRLRDEIKILVLTREGGGRGNPNVYRLDWTKGVRKSEFKPKKRVTSGQKKGDTAKSPEPSSIEPSYSRRDADASPDVMKNPFGYFCEVAKALRVTILPEDRAQTSKHFKDLVRIQEPNKEELKRVVSKMLEARTAGADWSPQKALEKVRGSNVVNLPSRRPEESMVSTAGYRRFE